MALVERRYFKALQDETVPKYKTEIDSITGVPIAWELDEQSMVGNIAFMKHLDTYLFDSIRVAFLGVCRDSLGKQAVKEGIETIRIARDPAAKDSSKQVWTADKVLHIRFYWGDPAESLSFYPSAEDIERCLENSI